MLLIWESLGSCMLSSFMCVGRRRNISTIVKPMSGLYHSYVTHTHLLNYNLCKCIRATLCYTQIVYIKGISVLQPNLWGKVFTSHFFMTQGFVWEFFCILVIGLIINFFCFTLIKEIFQSFNIWYLKRSNSSVSVIETPTLLSGSTLHNTYTAVYPIQN